jgi:hypothetical protein
MLYFPKSRVGYHYSISGGIFIPIRQLAEAETWFSIDRDISQTIIGSRTTCP